MMKANRALRRSRFVPADPQFIDFFDNPPYTVKIVY
jgi:hypothetical protein